MLFIVPCLLAGEHCNCPSKVCLLGKELDCPFHEGGNVDKR